tara:strand:+ start:363 stop:1025 length:663 start_codon:yes stop_codon:yes gene_type:complete
MLVEYLIGNPGTLPNSWTATPIGVNPPTSLNGFTIGMRPYTETLDPTTNLPVRTYPPFTVSEQTLVVSSPTPPLFTTDTGSELFTSTTVVGGYATAGITDGTSYSYVKVFDQTDFKYIEKDYVPPPCPPPVDDSISGDLPLEPYDPSAGIYPYSTLTTYIPDTRDVVTVTYTLTTKYSIGAGDLTDVTAVTQDVTQTINDWSDECRYYLKRGSYYNEFNS